MTMNSALRSMFAVCVIFTLVCAAVTAQRGTPPDRPWSINVFIDKTGISVYNSSPRSPDRTKVWARAGGAVTFVVENHDAIAHTVRIPVNEFVPSRTDAPGYKRSDGCATQKPKQKGNATPDPMEAGQTDNVTVNSGEVRLLVLKVKKRTHFKFSKDPLKGMTYKYNIYSLPLGGKEIPCDPDIEIQQPPS